MVVEMGGECIREDAPYDDANQVGKRWPMLRTVDFS